jgi:DNA-3-methyladenine glycosylase
MEQRAGLSSAVTAGRGACTAIDGRPTRLRRMPRRTRLPRAFYRRETTHVARELLNKILAMPDGRTGRIVEVEAYCAGLDPAAHTYRGKTARNATMFGEPGHLYVYFTYGMHWCANAVAWDKQPGAGVLIRALEPIDGLPGMYDARGGVSERLLSSGPARLTQALGITGALDGADLVKGGGPRIVDDGTPPPSHPIATPRIGIRVGLEHLWRFYVPNNPHVSPARVRHVQ